MCYTDDIPEEAAMASSEPQGDSLAATATLLQDGMGIHSLRYMLVMPVEQIQIHHPDVLSGQYPGTQQPWLPSKQ